MLRTGALSRSSSTAANTHMPPRTWTTIATAWIAAMSVSGCARYDDGNRSGTPADPNPYIDVPDDEQAGTPDATVAYRCDDKSIVLVNYFADDVTAYLYTQLSQSPIKLTAPAPGRDFIASGYRLGRPAPNVKLERPGHAPTTCTSIKAPNRLSSDMAPDHDGARAQAELDVFSMPLWTWKDIELHDAAAFDEPACIVAFFQQASSSELLHYRQIEHEARRRRFVQVHGAVRLLFRAQFGSAYAQIDRSHTANAINPSRPAVSLSYAADRAVIAIARSSAIGVDLVQDALDAAPLDALMATPAEQHAVGNISPCRDLAVWAAKEATAKRYGDVSREPEEWVVERSRYLRVRPRGSFRAARVHLLRPFPGYLAAIAV